MLFSYLSNAGNRHDYWARFSGWSSPPMKEELYCPNLGLGRFGKINENATYLRNADYWGMQHKSISLGNATSIQNHYLLRRPHPAAATRRRGGIFLYVIVLYGSCISEPNAFFVHSPIICISQICCIFIHFAKPAQPKVWTT